jgi:TBC domain-containing protein kinase-like protein
MKEVHRKISTDSEFSTNSLPNETRNSVSDGLKMEAIPLPDLKKEKCPRISGEDFLALLDLNKTRFSRPKIIVVDVRNYEDYNRGAVPTSINMPYTSAFSADGALLPTNEANILNANRGKIIAVVGNRGDSAVKFAEALLALEFPRICVLHRGIDIFRSCNILVVPSSMNNL